MVESEFKNIIEKIPGNNSGQSPRKIFQNEVFDTARNLKEDIKVIITITMHANLHRDIYNLKNT